MGDVPKTRLHSILAQRYAIALGGHRLSSRPSQNDLVKDGLGAISPIVYPDTKSVQQCHNNQVRTRLRYCKTRAPASFCCPFTKRIVTDTEPREN